MNLFPMPLWVVFLFFSTESLLPISLVYSAPVKYYDSPKKGITRILDTDEKLFKPQYQFVPNDITPVPIFKKKFLVEEYQNNSQGHTWLKKDTANTDMDMQESYTNSDEYVKDCSLKTKKKSNWSQEVILLACVLFLFALMGGAAVYSTIYDHSKREETTEPDSVAETLIPLKPVQELDKWKPKEKFSETTDNKKELEILLYLVLKTERKKKRHKKKRRSESRMNIRRRRRKELARKKGNKHLGVNAEDIKILDLSKQNGELQKMPEKGNYDRGKMKDAKWEYQVLLSAGLPYQIPAFNIPSFKMFNLW